MTKGCKMRSANATSDEIELDHKVKMRAKKLLNQRQAKMYRTAPYVPANLSQNHPDYGMSMTDHLKEKAGRNTEKSS